MKLNSRERLLLILIVIVGVVLVGKSLLEGYSLSDSASEGERSFYEWVGEKQTQEYSEGLYKSGVVSIKLISIKERSQEEGDFYVAKLRKYLFGVIPFSDVYIKESQSKFINNK